MSMVRAIVNNLDGVGAFACDPFKVTDDELEEVARALRRVLRRVHRECERRADLRALRGPLHGPDPHWHDGDGGTAC